MISIEHASCTFRHASGQEVRALDDVDIVVNEGEFVCLLGPSGHGKSTLLRSLAGLNGLSEGTIRVNGKPVQGPGVERGMVFQEDTVFPWMRVGENVQFGLKCQGVGVAERSRRAAEWLSSVGLAHVARSWPKELSGGMRKRVAVASVFATGAPILLMDEPFGALDYVTRTSLQNLLLDMWARTRRTIVFVTHDIEEALVLAERIIVMRHGRVAEQIAVGLPRPRDEAVRALPEAVRITSTILGHLGLKHRPAATLVDGVPT